MVAAPKTMPDEPHRDATAPGPMAPLPPALPRENTRRVAGADVVDERAGSETAVDKVETGVQPRTAALTAGVPTPANYATETSTLIATGT